jgi:hypothetical protein
LPRNQFLPPHPHLRNRPPETHELTDDALATPHTPATRSSSPPPSPASSKTTPPGATPAPGQTSPGPASGGSHWRNNTAGSTAELTFDGTWISLGFIADRWGGYADITIDGEITASLTSTATKKAPVSFLFDGLPAGSTP